MMSLASRDTILIYQERSNAGSDLASRDPFDHVLDSPITFLLPNGDESHALFKAFYRNT